MKGVEGNGVGRIVCSLLWLRSPRLGDRGIQCGCILCLIWMSPPLRRFVRCSLSRWQRFPLRRLVLQIKGAQDAVHTAESIQKRKEWMEKHPVQLSGAASWEEWRPSVNSWFKVKGETDQQLESRLRQQQQVGLTFRALKGLVGMCVRGEGGGLVPRPRSPMLLDNHSARPASYLRGV